MKPMNSKMRPQSVQKATGVGTSGKGKATVRKHQGGGKTSGLGGGKPESK
jgi:hypothetical protein